jgi:hypothetical protein
MLNSLIVNGLGAVLGPVTWKQCDCVFTLSTGRTGTALLTRLLSLSSKIDAYHEPPPNPREYYAATYERGWEDCKAFATVLKKLRCRQIGAARISGRMYCETSNRLTFFAPAICIALPRTRWIHLYRHPGGVVRSGMCSGWYDRHKFEV